MHRRHLVFGAALLACAVGTRASSDPAPKYGVVSLLGDSINVTGSRPNTGSNIDQNDKVSMDLSDAGFDATALRTIEDTVKTLAPRSATALFAIKAPKWVEDPSSLFDGDKLKMSPKLIEAMKADGATHLFLLTSMRAQAQLRFDNGWYGQGRVEGLGFYLDRQQRVVNKTTGATTYGYLAPHAYLSLALVDLSSATVVNRQKINAAYIYTAPLSNESTHPWNAIDAAEKLKILNQMIEREVKKAVGLALESR